MSKKQHVDIMKKVAKEFPEFVDSVNGLTTEEINGRLAQAVKDLQEANESEEADDALTQLRNDARSAGAPYRELRKAIKLKSGYLIATLKERGVK